MSVPFSNPCAAAGIPDLTMCHRCEVRDLAICGALDETEMARLDSIVTHIHLNPGQTLFYEGDESGFFFNIATGTLRLYKMLPDGRRQITGFVLPGDFLGLASTDSMSYTVEAVTEAGVCRFTRKELDRLCETFPDLERRLLGKVRDELVTAQEQMLLLGRKTPKEKIASFLLRLSRRAERWAMPSNPVILSMSRGDIADYLGMTVETVSRTLTKLKSSGLIQLPEPHRVVLADMARLEDLAEGD